jgi:hypothetical protein
MRTLFLILSAVLLAAVITAPGAAQAGTWTSWQTRADAALKGTVTDSVAERMRKILFSDGKNDRVEFVMSEPDGDGLLARIKITWSGIVIAVPYSAVIRWRFDASRHISSDVESAFGMGVILNKDRVALDDYLRTELYPKVIGAIK